MSNKKLTIDSLEERFTKHVSSYSCDNCGERFKISHKESQTPNPAVCPNPFCREREKFTLLKSK